MTTRPDSLTTEERLAERFDLLGRQMGLRGEAPGSAEVLAWQAALRGRLRAAVGLDGMQPCALDPEHGPVEDLGDHTRQRVTIAVEPGVRMPLYVLRAAGARGPSAAVIATHGHGGGGKESVAGRREDPLVAEAIDRYRYDYGLRLALAGFTVLCPDARGFGERRERGGAETGPLGGSCRVLNNMAIPLGLTVTGMWTWDLMRLADYAATREDCDAGRLAAAGLSGGGLQALWLGALDERVRCLVVSGYFYGYKESLLRLHENCSCNYVPGLWQLADVGDIGALAAPRPMLVESGSRDPLNGAGGLENVRGQLQIAARAYRALGAEGALAHSVFEGEHRWDGAGVVEWLQRWIG